MVACLLTEKKALKRLAVIKHVYWVNW